MVRRHSKKCSIPGEMGARLTEKYPKRKLAIPIVCDVRMSLPAQFPEATRVAVASRAVRRSSSYRTKNNRLISESNTQTRLAPGLKGRRRHRRRRRRASAHVCTVDTALKQ
ncbi:hypothetical protein CEXT_248201 [Caerostris extrusa]|uniref:Uncharacterized protein n=1 Tax=Caerostris extrusa TaxID=172846 RepID=A0AAV4XTA3_CAEEX|nr:hypothetical protein CEXT_248201 [Caerostris extrusa]